MSDLPSQDVIDLTDETAPSAASITPDRPTKRTRVSRRHKTHRVSVAVKNDASKSSGNEEKEESPPEYEADNINGYFEINEILERRTKKYGSESGGLRQVVEYLVSWKIPADYTGDESYYEPSWLVAEHLNQHSLVQAFRKFPMDADPERRSSNDSESTKSDGLLSLENFVLRDKDFSDDEDDDSGDEEAEGEEVGSDEMQAFDLEDDEKPAERGDVDREVSHLQNSDYDSPGTVELVLNRRTYRVGQSFFSDSDKSYIYTISMIQPIPRKAQCLKYMKLTKTFVCPKGEEESYILLNNDFILDLASLKEPCKDAFKKLDMRYEQEDEKQRAFAYYNDLGQISHHPTGRPTCLDLFAGAGGMCLGLEKYFNVKWVVDNDPLAAATLRANKTNADAHIYTEDLKTFLKKSYQGDPCYPSPGEIDHIHGSPPCKGFSRANRSGGKDDKMNNKQTLIFINAIRHFRPKTVSFENVPGLVLEEFKGYLQFVVSSLMQIGYQLRVKVLSSEKYGDPQRRRRLIILAARNDVKLPDMPEPTHGHDLLPIMTCKDALQKFEGELPTKSKSCGAVRIGDAIVYNHIIPRQKPGVNDDYELIEDQPSRTILARSRPHIHYNGERFISVREAACLQSFPATYRFFGSTANQYSQVGNAVPVKLSTAIARSVAVVHGCAV